MIISSNIVKASFLVEDEAFTGVKKIVTKVSEDLKAVTGNEHEIIVGKALSDVKNTKILVATVGRSAILDKLSSEGKIDLSKIEGKWESYLWAVIDGTDGDGETLVIAGSDKRGTIYGLFRLSELAGVSPWVWFADVPAPKKDSFEISKEDCIVSKEPSVKYRGFFINDEWPSFGNWTFEHFGGFTTEMYEHVFELLLRLKGNYLWPAMWTSNFSLDGPGLSNAELADELGIVMSNSHHEPCLRHSEEWDLVKGDDTPYGSAWNFDKNREGLTNYWRDGLKRNGKFENIITMGMRGERDSEVLGQTATLKDNIDYLKEVIETQNKLIQETIDDNLDNTHRMLAIYKEVERYFNGDDTAEGLKTWEGLDGITCMLCEDNFGNLRTLPEDSNRDRQGGWGMYYHFDYHGDPVSYEWVNSTDIARTRDQMSQAYEYGIKEIWIVNVGDLKPQEFPLSYFLDLAYDIDKWGTGNDNAINEYYEKWANQQFGAKADCEKIVSLLKDYTHINNSRRPEALLPETYHPCNYGESDKMYALAEDVINSAEDTYATLKGSEYDSAFYQLIYYPAVASANVLKLQLAAGKNHLLAKMGAKKANEYAAIIDECIEKDRALVKEYHSINGGKWNGLMLSEHIGFANWNDEECVYPIKMLVEPTQKHRMIVTAGNCETFTMGGDWTRKTLLITDFLDTSCSESYITVLNGSKDAIMCSISCADSYIMPELTEFEVDQEKRIAIKLDRSNLSSGNFKTTLRVDMERTHVDIEIPVANTVVGGCAECKQLPILPEEYFGGNKTRMSRNGKPVNELGISLSMSDAVKINPGKNGEYRLLKPFGKFGEGLKAFPVLNKFVPGVDAPSAEFEFALPKDMKVEITIITAPDNPVVKDNRMNVGISINDKDFSILSLVEEGYEGGERRCPSWGIGVMNQCHKTVLELDGKTGINSLKIYAADPGVVLEKLLIRQAGTEWAEGYLGL